MEIQRQREKKETSASTGSLPESLKGGVEIGMTNDYLFHIVMERDLFALKGLIAALLHIPVETILKIEVKNPILKGDNAWQKEYVLDILVVFNDSTYVNLEMQVKDHQNWVPRSLSYLSREFNHLIHGEDYSDVHPVHHIGFLDYTLFEDHPEFFATYRMRNVQDGYLYTDIFTLSVVELNHIELATEEDRHYKIDKWAELFKARTWEEIKMLAKEDAYLESAAKTMYSSVTDPVILSLCRRRQEDLDADEYYRNRTGELESLVEELTGKIEKKDYEIVKLTEKIAEQKGQIAEQKGQIAEQKGQIAEQKDQIAEQKDQIAEQKDQLCKVKEDLAEMRRMLMKES